MGSGGRLRSGQGSLLPECGNPPAQRCGETQKSLSSEAVRFSGVSLSSDFPGYEARLSSILRVDHPFSLSLWVFILKTGRGGSERLRAL